MSGPALALPSQIYIAWPEPIVVTSVFSNPTNNIVANVTDAGVYQLGNREGAPSQGVYTKFTIEVTVGLSDLPFVPKPADTVLWNGNTYTVQDVQTFNWLQYHKIHALNLILAFQLVQSGALTRPSNTQQDAAGRQALTTYTNVAAAIPCRLQPMGGDAGDAMERRLIPQRFTAYCAGQFVPQALDKFTLLGQDYTVVGFGNPQSITSLLELHLELIQ